MDIWAWAQIYLVIAGALAGTSYFTLFRPGVDLAEEILNEKLPWHRGITATVMWLVISAAVAPWTAIVLLSNNNASFINDFATHVADRIIEEEED